MKHLRIGYQDMDNIQEILNERESRYGDYTKVSFVSQVIKNATRQYLSPMHTFQRESLDMIANKIARICCGDPDYIDSWDDIAGYAQLVANELRKKNNDG